MKKIKLFLAALLAIVGASSMKALEPADLVGNYLWNYKDGNVDRENTVSIAVSGDELTISDMFLDPLKATIQEEGGDTYLVIAKGQGGIYNGKSQYEVQGSADRLTGWGEADIKGKIGTDGVITFDCYLRAFIVGTGSTIGSDYGKGSTFTPLSGELPSVVELPAGATVKKYQLAYMQLGKRKTKAVGVAIVDNDVYVQGFADFLPEAWVKGTISANKWTFPANQYLGKLDNNDCYFFSNGETTFTYNGEDAYVATQVSGKVAGVVLALYIGPELSKEFDPVPYASISIDGENMTFRYDLDYYSASEEVGTSFSHVYRLPWTGYQPEWWNDVETLGKIKKVSFNASFGKYEDITDLYGFFAGMEKLTTIEGLEYLVTKNAMHTASMFKNCKSLTSLDLSTFDTSGITDGTMASMFSGCESLKSITFGEKFSTAGANDMQYMFYNCQALESLDLSKFDTEKVTNMANMFSGCKSLKSITFGEDFKASGVKDMNDMFYNCQALKSLDLSSFDTGNVTDMQYMFAGCKALESLDLSKFDTGKVTDMQGMFYGCEALKELDLSNFNTGKVEYMSYMFRECKALESLNLSSFNIGKVQQMYDMFYQCSSLQTIYSAEDADWRNEYSGGMFSGCTSLSGKFGSKEFSFAEHPMDDGTYAKVYTGNDDIGGYFTSIKEKPEPYAVFDGSTLTFYYDGNKPTVGGDISEVYDLPWDEEFPPLWANLMGNSSIVTAKFDKSFADYKPDYTSGMFYRCEKLKEIKGIEYLNTENVTSMWGMFYNCSSLETLDLNNFDTGNVTSMGYMFYGCEKLEMLDLSSFDTGNVTDMEKMFSGCSNLETIYCNKDWAKDGLSSTEMFSGCTKLKGGSGTVYDASHVDAAYAHVDVAGDPGYFTEKYAYAVLSEDGKTLTFYYDAKKAQWQTEVDEGTVYDIPWGSVPGWRTNSTITTVTFDESFKDYNGLKNTSYMFYYLTKLETINNLENLNTEHVTDMSYMFFCCSSLKSLDLGDNFDTSSVKDMTNMFYRCSSLKSLDLGDKFNTSNVTNMYLMFYMCEELKTLDLGDKFDTSKVTNMQNMFAITSLESLDLGDKFNTSNVTNMSMMFYKCTKLTSLDVSSFDIAKVTDMSSMFNNCSNLETIYCAEGADWSGVEGRDYNGMFALCTKLSGKYGSKEFKFNGTVDGTYAKVCTADQDGYFTYKGNEGYTLTVTKAGMATLYLDYDAVIPEGVEVYYCTGLDDDEAVPTTEKTHAVKINSSYLIPARTGVFVKAAPGEYVFEHPKSDQLYIVALIIENILTGTLEDKTVDPRSVLTLGYANNADETLGFWWYTGTTIPANRAYIPGDKLPAEVKGIRLLFGDEETGIKTTNLTNQTNEAGAWYTIDGRKLEGKPTQKGIYIVNGKKMMVK